MITRNSKERTLVRQLLADACAADLPELGSILLRVLIVDELLSAYGGRGIRSVRDSHELIDCIVREDGVRGVDVVEAKAGDIVCALKRRLEEGDKDCPDRLGEASRVGCM